MTQRLQDSKSQIERAVLSGKICVICACFIEDRKSVEETLEFFENSDLFARERKLGTGMERTNALIRGSDGQEIPKERREHAYAASPQAHVFRYQQKIREAFNRNDLGDAYYVALES